MHVQRANVKSYNERSPPGGDEIVTDVKHWTGTWAFVKFAPVRFCADYKYGQSRDDPDEWRIHAIQLKPSALPVADARDEMAWFIQCWAVALRTPPQWPGMDCKQYGYNYGRILAITHPPIRSVDVQHGTHHTHKL